MPMNLDAVGAVSDPGRHSWTSKDALLYALGVGAGQTDPTGFELEFTTENSQRREASGAPDDAGDNRMGGGRRSAELGATSTPRCSCTASRASRTLHGPIPPDGEVEAITTIVGIYDKG